MIKNECGHAFKLLDHAECLWCENCVEKLIKRLDKKPGITEEWIEEKAERLREIVEMVGSCPKQWIEYDEAKYIHDFKNFIRSLVEEIKK